MNEQHRKEVLRTLEQRGITLEELAQSSDCYLCYAKAISDLEDPVASDGWYPLEGIIGDERLEALQAGAEPTDGEMQLLRDEIVRQMFTSEASAEDLPSAHFCSLPENFGSQVLVVFASRIGVDSFDFDLFGLFENEGRAIDALRTDYFLNDDISS